MPRQLNGWEAAAEAFVEMLPYFLLAFLIAVLAALVAAIAARLRRGRAPAAAESQTDFVGLSLYCICFTTFGTVTAYFIAQGLLDQSGQVTNALLASFVAPFVALLTGGVTFVAAKSHQDVSRSEVVLGVVCFLLSCVLAYETFKVQLTRRIDPEPPAAVQAPPPPSPNGAREEPGVDNEADADGPDGGEIDFNPNQL